MIEHIPFINEQRTKEFGIHEFFKKILEQLRWEINHLVKAMYDTGNPERVFAQNERTHVGIFNNAIVRAFGDRVVTLQEWSVYYDKGVGRADFLVHWNNGGAKPVCLLFEAKQYTIKSDRYMNNDSIDYINNVMAQGLRYYKAEDAYYADKTTYIVPIFFAWLRGEHVIKKAREYHHLSTNKDNAPTDFCSLYYLKDKPVAGVWVHGRIYDPKEINVSLPA